MNYIKFLTLVSALIILPTLGNAQKATIRIRLDNCELDSASLKRIQDSFNFLLTFYEDVFPEKEPEEYYARLNALYRCSIFFIISRK